MGLNLATVTASLAFISCITVAVSLRPLSLNSKCEDLHVDLCKGLDYNQTFFPNSLNHLNQVEANSYLSQFSLLIQSGCYEDIKLFLCSIFIPVCTTHNEPILPCRRFCKRAKRACGPKMKMHGYNWPSILKCSKFPKKSDQMCLEKPRPSRKNKKNSKKTST